MSRKVRRVLTRSVLPPLLIVAAVLIVWQLASNAGMIRATVLPGPAVISRSVVAELHRQEFWVDAQRTLSELVLAFGIGLLLGLLAGLAFWRQPLLGRIFEPYLVAFYAVPLVVFYPVAIVVIGLNQWPVVALASVMTAIPIALNTWNGLTRIPDVYLKLGRSLRASPTQMAVKVMAPAAAPLLFAGIKLGAVYALIGVVAMEFMTATAGLGYQIRYQYEYFDEQRMYAYIAIIFALSLLLTGALELLERRVGSR